MQKLRVREPGAGKILYGVRMSSAGPSAKTGNRMSRAAHGSHVAGIIAAQGANGFGIAGINQNVKLYGYSTLSSEAAASEAGVWGDIFLYKYALSRMLNQGVKVINVSMGFPEVLKGAQDGDSFCRTFLSVNSQSLENFLLKYIRQGQEFLICKAAGNESTPDHRYDAAYDVFGAISDPQAAERILIVGAADYSGDGYYYVSDFSNTGNRVDLYAPGVDILSDYPSNVTALMSGTSMSTPVVTGLASLVWGMNPDLSAAQVKSILEASSYSTLFELDGKSYIGRDWAELWHDTVAIVDAGICVQLARGTKGTAAENGEAAAFGSVEGIIYLAPGDGELPEAVTVTDISVLDENGQLVQRTEPEKIAIPIQDPQTGDQKMLELSSYTALLEPGSYTIQVTAEDREPVSQQVVIGTNTAEILNFEFLPSLFEEMAGEYVFTSGAGAWATMFTLEKDGSFSGQYMDSNMGETGSGYPNGTTYICSFEGKFAEPEQADDYTYTTRLESFREEGTPGEEYIENGIRYVYSYAYGFDQAGEFRIYVPGTPLEALPEEFLSWVQFAAGMRGAEDLPFYGIYNVNGKCGFSGSSSGD